MKKKLMKVLALFVLMLMPSMVHAAEKSEPVYVSTGELPAFYANGTAITISENKGKSGAIIKYGGNSIEVSERTTVFGGGVAGTSFDSSSITMNGGTVASIIGGGEGTPTEAANVGNVTIKITGGTVSVIESGGKNIKGSVAGGGVLYSTVDTVNIEITGGTIYSVMGGGFSHSKYNNVATDVGTKTEPENSKNRTGDVVITISGGKIYSDQEKYGLVYGGGQGYSYVKNTSVTVSGNADLSGAWLVAGGSNGRTDYGTLNIKGGSIYTVQTINRGSMINARVNMTGGTVTNMYVGGEDPETFDKDIVNGGFIGNVIVDLTKGNVTKLYLGSNYDNAIAKDADYAKVFYEKTVVGNNKDLASMMGSIANPYIKEGIVAEKVTEDKIINSDFLKALKETANVYTVSVNDKYEWVIAGSDITNPSIKIDTKIELSNTAPTLIEDGIKEEIDALGLTDVLFMNFAHHGQLPGKATILYNVKDLYDDGTVLYILHYNEETGKLEGQQKVTVKDGVIAFDIESCSSYVLSKTEASRQVDSQPDNNTELPPKTGDINLTLLIVTIGVGLAGLGIVSKKAYNVMK